MTSGEHQMRRMGQTRSLTVYIAGPMSGLPEFNYPAFFEAERLLIVAGFDTLNPARTEGRDGCKTWLDFMRASLRDLADSDGIAMLPAWHNSRGAAFEYRVGHDLGLPVATVDEWLSGEVAAS